MLINIWQRETLFSLFVSLESGDPENDSKYCRIDASHWYQLKDEHRNVISHLNMVIESC